MNCSLEKRVGDSGRVNLNSFTNIVIGGKTPEQSREALAKLS